MAAPARNLAAGYEGKKTFQLNLVGTLTETHSNGGEDTILDHHVFTLPYEPMLDETTALPFVERMLDYFVIPIPLDAVVVSKVVDSASRLLAVTSTPAPPDADGKTADVAVPDAVVGGGDDDDTASWLSKDGLPLTTINVDVEHGVLTSVRGDFDPVDSDDSDDSDEDEDDDDDDEDGADGDGDDAGVKAMEE